jgi:tRNA (guanine26-N2/guanine27-N2)-dimethyltransferase
LAVERIRANAHRNQTQEARPCGEINITQEDFSTVVASRTFHIIDLDPCGSPAPHFAAAMRSIANGGLLCIASTDLNALTDPVKSNAAASRYGATAPAVGGTAVGKEMALRIVLGSLSRAAIACGRTIKPLLCVAVEFYIRLFVIIVNDATEEEEDDAE